MRPGHYPVCSPSNPFFIRGYSEHPIAFCNAVFYNKNNQLGSAAPARPAAEVRLEETISNQNPPEELLDSQNIEDHDTQNNKWVASVFSVPDFLLFVFHRIPNES